MEQPAGSPAFRVAVVGGGIGGLFCVLAIQHHCSKAGFPVQIDVYEQAREYKEIGNGIGLGLNAARLIYKLGIGSQLREVSAERSGFWFSFRRYDNSEVLVSVALPDRPGEVREASCSRHDVLELLKRTVEERQAATLHTQKACVRAEEQGESVAVHFQDGSIAIADLVIGADGIHSVLRNQFSEDNPMNSGRVAYRAVVPIDSLGDSSFTHGFDIWVAKDRHLITYPITHGGKYLNIGAFVTKGKSAVAGVKESWTSRCDRKEVEEEFTDFDEPVRRIISAMGDRPGKWLLNDRNPLARWNFLSGRVVLLGDAAHAMLPHMGAGAGQALEDGWVLGRILSDYLSKSPESCFANLESAMQLYQDLRLPRAQRVQAGSRRAGLVNEMRFEKMDGLSYEECLPVFVDNTRERMDWVWGEDLDSSYEKLRSSYEAA